MVTYADFYCFSFHNLLCANATPLSPLHCFSLHSFVVVLVVFLAIWIAPNSLFPSLSFFQPPQSAVKWILIVAKSLTIKLNDSNQFYMNKKIDVVFLFLRFYLLAADRSWHGSCLRCSRCSQPLDTELSCFARDGNIYCKEDYYR